MKATESENKDFSNWKVKNPPEHKTRVLCSNIERLIELTVCVEEATTTAEAFAILSDIRMKAKEIKEHAVAMEKRLYLYKETIEGLGFKRVRK